MTSSHCSGTFRVDTFVNFGDGALGLVRHGHPHHEAPSRTSQAANMDNEAKVETNKQIDMADSEMSAARQKQIHNEPAARILGHRSGELCMGGSCVRE